MIYTSYFAMQAKLKSAGIRCFSVANTNPLGLVTIKHFVPNWDRIVGPYKAGKLTIPEYTKLYRAQLDELTFNASDFSQQFDNIAMMCYERATDFCHRHVLRDWLADEGVKSMEWREDL